MIHLLNQLSPSSGWRIGFVLFALIGTLDFFSGYQVSMVGFYFLTVAFIAWCCGRKAAVLASFFGAILWWTLDHYSSHVYAYMIMGVWNALMRLLLFTVGGIVCAELRRVLDEKEILIEELRLVLERVKTLTGILPSCSCCHRVRNKGGEWNSLETYVRDKTQIEFLESVCPECAHRNQESDVPNPSSSD